MVSTQTKQGKVVPWSYSSLNAFEQCPRRYYLTRIAKQVTEKQTEATLHGNTVHKAMEDAVNGKRALPATLVQYQPLVDKLRKAPGVKLVESRFALTKSLQPCDYWSDQVWVRGVLDYGVVNGAGATIIDYKTGKRKLDIDQLRMFALAGMAQWPAVQTVKTAYLWLQSKTLDQEVFTRAQKAEIHQEFAARVHRMEQAEKTGTWPPRPSGLCREWCPVGKSLCEHCGK